MKSFSLWIILFLLKTATGQSLPNFEMIDTNQQAVPKYRSANGTEKQYDTSGFRAISMDGSLLLYAPPEEREYDLFVSKQTGAVLALTGFATITTSKNDCGYGKIDEVNGAIKIDLTAALDETDNKRQVAYPVIGSESVMVTSKPAARLNDTQNHAGVIIPAASTVFIEGNVQPKIEDCPEPGGEVEASVTGTWQSFKRQAGNTWSTNDNGTETMRFTIKSIFIELHEKINVDCGVWHLSADTYPTSEGEVFWTLPNDSVIVGRNPTIPYAIELENEEIVATLNIQGITYSDTCKLVMEKVQLKPQVYRNKDTVSVSILESFPSTCAKTFWVWNGDTIGKQNFYIELLIEPNPLSPTSPLLFYYQKPGEASLRIDLSIEQNAELKGLKLREGLFNDDSLIVVHEQYFATEELFELVWTNGYKDTSNISFYPYSISASSIPQDYVIQLKKDNVVIDKKGCQIVFERSNPNQLIYGFDATKNDLINNTHIIVHSTDSMAYQLCSVMWVGPGTENCNGYDCIISKNGSITKEQDVVKAIITAQNGKARELQWVNVHEATLVSAIPPSSIIYRNRSINWEKHFMITWSEGRIPDHMFLDNLRLDEGIQQEGCTFSAKVSLKIQSGNGLVKTFNNDVLVFNWYYVCSWIGPIPVNIFGVPIF